MAITDCCTHNCMNVYMTVVCTYFLTFMSVAKLFCSTCSHVSFIKASSKAILSAFYGVCITRYYLYINTRQRVGGALRIMVIVHHTHDTDMCETYIECS